MNKRIFVCSLLFAACFLFASCKEPDETEDMITDGNETRDIAFSHNSGLYSDSFDLILTAKAGSRIYYSIDGSIPLPSKVRRGGPVFQYISSFSVKDRDGDPNILAIPDNVSKMYPHPTDPYEWKPQPYYPTADQVPKATVIRAIAVDANGKQSAVLTRTYFIGKNLDRYENNPVISIITDPVNLLDYDTGIMVQGPGRSRDDYNYAKKGREWEREAHIDFFDGSKSVGFTSPVGIRIRGGWSREHGQKSFNVYFREEYGMNYLNRNVYNLIPGAVRSDGVTPVARYKNFMLRNGGNDTTYTKLRDVYTQSLFTDRNFTVQTGVPCVAYLNGEYWGFYNLQEKYSDNFIEYKYGVNKDNVVSVETWEIAEGTEADWPLYNNMMAYRNKPMTNQTNYDEFCELFDIQSFIDYFAAEIYIYNEDWPHNNYQLWRVRNKENGNPYGDGKWRWMMYDTEFAMGIYTNGSLTGQSGKDPFDEILNGDDKNHQNNLLFKNLLTNADFRRQFVITMMDLYNVNFDYNSNIAKLDEMAAMYRPLMNQYFNRFGQQISFDGEINKIKSYMGNIRTEMTNNYLPAYLGVSAGNLYDVTLSASGANGAVIKINTVPRGLSSGWKGKYFCEYPVTVTAVAPSGYKFNNWTVTGGTPANSTAATTEVTFSGNVTITANFSPN